MNNFVSEFPNYRVWAVVGVSSDQSKYGNKIYRDLRDAGYTVYAVNPKLETVEGDPCFASISALPQVPDVVDLVVPPAATMAVIEDCIAAGAKRVWYQPGSELPESIEKAEKAGMEVVYDACIMIQKKEWI